MRQAIPVWGALLGVVCWSGCASSKKGVSHFDAYDAVKVDQMVGNRVTAKPFERTLVCLNARRETRVITAVTNTAFTTLTNMTVTPVTNQTVSLATNLVITSATSVTPPASAGMLEATNAVSETNVVVIVAPATGSTNVTLALSTNSSSVIAPNQTASNQQSSRNYNHQFTTTSNNMSVSFMTNLVTTVETNLAVSYQTNTTLTAVTNVTTTPTNYHVHDCFLYTGMTPPPDFQLASGESLALLVDGARHGFTQSTSGTAFVGRKGYNSLLYRVPPEVLVAIANAKEVKIRFKGTTSVVERTMNQSSRRNFRKFLLKYFSPDPATVAPQPKNQQKQGGTAAPEYAATPAPTIAP